MTIIRTAISAMLTLAAGGLILGQWTMAEARKIETYEVRYSPSNLATPDQAKTIIHRIHETANNLCWDEFGPKRFMEKLNVERCLRDVTQDLVEKVDDKNLDAAHRNNPAPKKLTPRGTLLQASYLGIGSR